MLLRDIIDLDATYGSGPSVEEITGDDDEGGENGEAASVETADADVAADAPAAKVAEALKEATAKAGDAAKPKEEGAPDGEAAESAEGTAGKEGTEGGESNADADDEEEEENNISLAAMEQALLPVVIEMLEQIADTYKKLSKVQEKRLLSLQKGEKAASATEKKFEKLKSELVDLMEGVHFNNNRLEQLVDQLYGLNRGLVGLEGKLLRMAEKRGVNRSQFLDEYFGHELDPTWIERMKTMPGKGWASFSERHAEDIVSIRSPCFRNCRPDRLADRRVPPHRQNRSDR